MGKICTVCGKSTLYGNMRRHKTTSNISRHGAWGKRAPRKNRNWKANMRQLKVSENNSISKVWVCMKCYKKVA